MTTDRDDSQVTWSSGAWSITNARWHIRTATCVVAVVCYLVVEDASGPTQFVAKGILTALIVGAGASEAANVVRDVHRYHWARWRCFAWMRYVVLIAGVLITLVVPYMLLVVLYPALRSSFMTSAALAILMALVAVACLALALVALLLVALLLWLPVAIVRSRLRERRRRRYRYPAS